MPASEQPFLSTATPPGRPHRRPHCGTTLGAEIKTGLASIPKLALSPALQVCICACQRRSRRGEGWRKVSGGESVEYADTHVRDLSLFPLDSLPAPATGRMMMMLMLMVVMAPILQSPTVLLSVNKRPFSFSCSEDVTPGRSSSSFARITGLADEETTTRWTNGLRERAP